MCKPSKYSGFTSAIFLIPLLLTFHFSFAQVSTEQKYQQIISQEVNVIRGASIAFSCGYRNYNWTLNVGQATVEAAKAAADNFWPAPVGQESANATKELQLALTEFKDAADDEASATPEQCTALIANDGLKPLDSIASLISGP